jgi:predicted ferric reductase
VRPPRGPRAAAEGPLAQLLQTLRDPAEGIGEWAFYIAVALIVMALVKRFPYHLFFKVHRLLAVAYLLLAVHAVVLMPTAYWTQAIAPVAVLLMAAGSAAAVALLLRRAGRSRRALAVVDDVEHHPASGVLALSARLQSRWRGHKTGQFAFVTFDRAEGAHPFTLTSAWRNDGQIRFMIKALGDYTRRLPGLVKAGALIQVEGPYGRFNFDSQQDRQVWVGGGIGITPFVARLQQLAAWPDGRAVDLFYTTALLDEVGVARLRADAASAGVRLHVMVDATDGRLDARRIAQRVPDWQQGSVWFCGPAGFGRSLRHDLLAMGLAADAFHQELFDLR